MKSKHTIKIDIGPHLCKVVRRLGRLGAEIEARRAQTQSNFLEGWVHVITDLMSVLRREQELESERLKRRASPAQAPDGAPASGPSCSSGCAQNDAKAA